MEDCRLAQAATQWYDDSHLLHVVRMFDVLLELAAQPMLVVYEGMVHLQPCTAIPPYSKLKLLQFKHQTC